MRISSKLHTDVGWIESSDEYASFAEAALEEAKLAVAGPGDEIKVRDEESGEIRTFKIVLSVEEIPAQAE